MPAYGSLEAEQAPDALGYYQRERTCSFITQRVLLGITAVVFMVLGIVVLVVTILLDVFLLSLWQNMFFAVFAFGVGLIVAGVTGSLAVHTRNAAALALFAFFALLLFAASVTMIYFAFDESTSLELPSIRDQWQEALNNVEQEGKLCQLQNDIGCRGWFAGCPVNSSVWATTPAPDITPAAALVPLLGDALSTSLSPAQSDSEVVANSESIITSSSSSSGGGEESQARRLRLMCPICVSNPSHTNKTCLTAIRQRVDDATPLITGGSFGMLILLAAMLAWSWKIRRKARASVDEQHHLIDEVNQNHPYKYL